MLEASNISGRKIHHNDGRCCGVVQSTLSEPHGTIAKAIHRSLRPKLYAHVDQCAPPTLLGGRKGSSVVFGGHLVRGFCRWQLHAKSSFAIVFADVASAYYSSIRELTARLPASRDSGSVPDFVQSDHDGLLLRLGAESILCAGGASSWLEAVTAELHRRNVVYDCWRRSACPDQTWIPTGFQFRGSDVQRGHCGHTAA